MRVKALLKILLMGSAILVCLLFVLLWRSGALAILDDPFDDLPFDRTMWIELRGSEDEDNPRGRMAGSLIDELEKDRPTRGAVIQMLGPSESDCGVLTPPVGPSKTCLSYNLGMWSGYRMDYDTLDVYFTQDERVSKVLTVQH